MHPLAQDAPLPSKVSVWFGHPWFSLCPSSFEKVPLGFREPHLLEVLRFGIDVVGIEVLDVGIGVVGVEVLGFGSGVVGIGVVDNVD